MTFTDYAHMLFTYPRRRRHNWHEPCGCEFFATPFGYRHNLCWDHWLYN